MRQLVLFLLLFFSMSCSQKSIQKNYDAEQPSELDITTDREFKNVMNNLIINSQFTAQQKFHLNRLGAELTDKLEANAVINVKLRVLLFKVLLAPTYNKKQVQVTREMILRNNIERNLLILETIEITKAITERVDQDDVLELPEQEAYLLF